MGEVTGLLWSRTTFNSQTTTTWLEMPSSLPDCVRRAADSVSCMTKHRSGGRLIGITYRVVYGDLKQVPALMGLNTAYVERTNLTSRQMNGRMVRKTLSFSKDEEMLKASCAWEDWVYNLTRPVKSLRVEVNNGQRRWQSRSAAMAAGLTDHVWTIEELMMTVAVPGFDNTK